MRIPTLAAFFTGLPALAIAQGYSGHMFDYGHGIGLMFGPVLWLIVLGLIVAGVIWFVRRTDAGHGPGASRALSELDLRFAKGEIDAEDYASRKKMLSE